MGVLNPPPIVLEDVPIVQDAHGNTIAYQLTMEQIEHIRDMGFHARYSAGRQDGYAVATQQRARAGL